jgi:hypothetical protein
MSHRRCDLVAWNRSTGTSDMISHPMVLAGFALDLTAFLAVLWFAATQIKIALYWKTGAPTSRQLRLERQAESSSLWGRAAVLVYVAGTIVFAVTLTSVLPDLVPGAMCGMGVIQASEGAMVQALVLRSLALLAMYFWHFIDRLNRGAPLAPLSEATARFGLLVVPFLALAVKDSFAAMWTLDTSGPVDCCAALYEKVGAATNRELAHAPWLGPLDATGLFLVSALALVGLAVYGLVARHHLKNPILTGCVAPLAIFWSWATTEAMLNVFCSYYYGVLHHPCPFCLFLIEHYAVGFLIFGGMAAVLLEGLAVPLAALLAHREPQVAPEANRLARRALIFVAVGVCVVTLLTMAPAVVWRIRHGVWMH